MGANHPVMGWDAFTWYSDSIPKTGHQANSWYRFAITSYSFQPSVDFPNGGAFSVVAHSPEGSHLGYNFCKGKLLRWVVLDVDLKTVLSESYYTLKKDNLIGGDPLDRLNQFNNTDNLEPSTGTADAADYLYVQSAKWDNHAVFVAPRLKRGDRVSRVVGGTTVWETLICTADTDSSTWFGVDLGFSCTTVDGFETDRAYSQNPASRSTVKCPNNAQLPFYTYPKKYLTAHHTTTLDLGGLTYVAEDEWQIDSLTGYETQTTLSLLPGGRITSPAGVFFIDNADLRYRFPFVPNYSTDAVDPTGAPVGPYAGNGYFSPWWRRKNWEPSDDGTKATGEFIIKYWERKTYADPWELKDWVVLTHEIQLSEEFTLGDLMAIVSPMLQAFGELQQNGSGFTMNWGVRDTLGQINYVLGQMGAHYWYPLSWFNGSQLFACNYRWTFYNGVSPRLVQSTVMLDWCYVYWSAKRIWTTCNAPEWDKMRIYAYPNTPEHYVVYEFECSPGEDEVLQYNQLSEDINKPCAQLEI